MRDDKENLDDVNNAKLEVIVKNLKVFDRRLYLNAKQTGSLLTVRGTMATGTLLSAMEFRDFCVHIIILPPLPPPHP